MKYPLLALLTDRPIDIDWTVLDENSPAVKWVHDYYNTYGELPSLQLFADECLDEGEEPIASAPWSYYVREAQDQQFVTDATKYLDSFNKSYALNPKGAILRLRDDFAQLTEPKQQTTAVDIAADTANRWKRFRQKQGSRIRTGIEPFDEASGGISPYDEFMILSARLGVGKSAILHFIALSMAKQGEIVGLYSGEMTEDEVGSRIDTWLTHVRNFDLTRGRLADSAAQEQAYKDEVPGKILVLTPKQIGHNATPKDLRKFCIECGITVLLIDQLSLMQPDGRQSTEMFQQFSNLSLQLKTLQQERRIPIVAVSQLNREAMKEEVNAANISGSDRIGQDATIILALERKNSELIIKCLKARSFKLPDTDWSFEWNMNEGILRPISSAADKIKARRSAAKAQDTISTATVDTSDEDFG